MNSPQVELDVVLLAAINRFEATLCRDPAAGIITLTDLAKSLDGLVATYFETTDVDPEGERDAPNREHSDYKKAYDRIGKAFPELGYYLHAWPDGELNKKQCDLGDAIDDLADIFGDLNEVRWHLNNSTLDEAVWHYRFGYQFHWGGIFTAFDTTCIRAA